MKKIFILLLLIDFILVTALPGVALSQSSVLRQGMKSEEIKALQEILKEDSAIYPEGYTTGYFGRLTTKAVKRLQKKFGLPETGIIDETTEKVIFPYLRIQVVSPNGGEVWDRSEIQMISWEILTPTPEKRVFWPKVSIDLFKRIKLPKKPCREGEECPLIERSIFVRHIAFANIFDRSYSWKITRDIPNGKNYIIRISTGRRFLPCILPMESRTQAECLKTKFTALKSTSFSPEIVNRSKYLPPSRLYWDESDAPFAIIGEIPPSLPNLEKVIAILEKISKELQLAIQLLKEVIISH